ncbi:MAG TPA: DUF5011 domain-containing protein [Trueperaceae bacterium]|nr:DUF5011 domain-containing protein [Trueperaceae bacterium]
MTKVPYFIKTIFVLISSSQTANSILAINERGIKVKREFSFRWGISLLAIVLVLVLAACVPNEPHKDNIPPVISLNGDNPTTVIKGSSYTEAGATAIDDVDGKVEVKISGHVDINKVASYTITYTAEDKAKNKTSRTRIINVIKGSDTTAPVITIKGDNPATVTKGSEYKDAGATAVDDRDGVVDVETKGDVDTSKVASYSITYSAIDQAKNKATATRTVNVILSSENKPPIAKAGDDQTVVERTDVTLDASASFDPDGTIKTYEWKENNTILSTKVNFTKNNFSLGEHNITLTVTDNKNATATDTVKVTITKAADSGLKVFIIGDSTVRARKVPWVNMSCDAYRGWGDDLEIYMTHPENQVNQARQGSTAETFRHEIQDDPARRDAYGRNQNWDYTEKLIKQANGGILLIQFGSVNEKFYYNEKYADKTPAERIALTKRDFKNALAYYVDRGIALGLSPILVTTPVGRIKNADGSQADGRGVYPGYTREVANEKNIPLIDLHKKTLHEFAKYSDQELQDAFGACTKISTGAIDKVHFEPRGSKIVAGWIKELSCELSNKLLCEQFSTTVDKVIPTISLKGQSKITINQGASYTDQGATAKDDVDGNISNRIVKSGAVNTAVAGDYKLRFNVRDSSLNKALTVTRLVSVIDQSTETVVVHEDAEDSNTNGWSTYGTTAGSSISNVLDDNKQSRVIVLSGNDGLKNGFLFDDVHVNSGFVVSWAMQYSNDFKFFVRVRTTNISSLFIYYSPESVSRGYEQANGLQYIHNALGIDAKNGSWQNFSRDIKADLKRVLPNDNLLEILSISVRGSGRIDDITTSTRAAKASFKYNGHSYEIVKTARSWQAAYDDAHNKGGFLAEINSEAENAEIYSRLNRYISQSEYAGSVASNGGTATYVWLGASDAAQEGKWLWINANTQFWSGSKTGNSVGGLYSNWGKDTNLTLHEPDNASNQDAAAIALTRWPISSGSLGQTSQWNDLIATDPLYYIIEFTE